MYVHFTSLEAFVPFFLAVFVALSQQGVRQSIADPALDEMAEKGYLALVKFKITTMAKKQKKAWELEIVECNLRKKELREEMRQLQKRIDEIKMQHGMKMKWNRTTPMIKFVRLNQVEAYNAMLKGWEPFLMEKIGANIKNVNYFKFDLSKVRNKFAIIRYLKIALTHSPTVFMLSDNKSLSQRELCLYLSEHSNLGSADCIRKALQRCDLEKWGHKNDEGYVSAEKADE